MENSLNVIRKIYLIQMVRKSWLDIRNEHLLLYQYVALAYIGPLSNVGHVKHIFIAKSDCYDKILPWTTHHQVKETLKDEIEEKSIMQKI